MSYDLLFWRQATAEDRSPRLIFDAFARGERVDGIPDLPVESILATLIDAFPGATREPNGSAEWVHWISPDGQSTFQVEWTTQYVWITCRPLDGDRANQMVDIANGFGCALYDPQTDTRFALP